MNLAKNVEDSLRDNRAARIQSSIKTFLLISQIYHLNLDLSKELTSAPGDFLTPRGLNFDL